MREQQTLLKQTSDFLRSAQLISPGQRILAAVSGGRDSCVMLHILCALREELGFALSVAHFNHNLREASGREQQFVGQLAADYGLPFYAGSVEAGVLVADGNIEDAARKARYAFLRQSAEEAGCQLIATAHHGQDQAETVLLHLLRGSGVEGLAAISPLENGLLRPLLFALPSHIEEYRAAENLAFCQDESNADARYLRNHLRLHILPQLAEINPRLLTALCATADICREDNDLLDELAQEALQQLWQPEQQAVGAGIFDLPLALQRRVLRLAVDALTYEEQVLSYAQTAAALKLKEEQQLPIGGGWLVYRRGGLHISRIQPPLLPLDEKIIPVAADGNWHKLADWGWEYKAMRNYNEPDAPEPAAYSIILPASMPDALFFRTRRMGDAVPSTGKAERRKLKDIFIKAKIPPHQRVAWPLLLAGEDIIWLPGLYQRKITPATPVIIVMAREYK